MSRRVSLRPRQAHRDSAASRSSARSRAVVQPPTIVRGVQDDAPDAARGKDLEEGAHQGVADAAPPPSGLHVDVEDDRFGSELQVVAVSAGPREDSVSAAHRHRQMTAGRDPLFSATQARYSPRGRASRRYNRCLSNASLVVREQSPHIPKHRRAMVRKERDVGRVSLAHGEQWLSPRHRWMSRW